MSDQYDSTEDTMEHIRRVQTRISQFNQSMSQRLLVHDASKLESPEKEIFDVMTPKLKALTYGSDEYKAALVEMGDGLKHHYAHNTHHPEHHEDGIRGMSLLDVVEMLADWKAASERHADGNMLNSLHINRERFNISDQLYAILLNTLAEMGW